MRSKSKYRRLDGVQAVLDTNSIFLWPCLVGLQCLKFRLLRKNEETIRSCSVECTSSTSPRCSMRCDLFACRSEPDWIYICSTRPSLGHESTPEPRSSFESVTTLATGDCRSLRQCPDHRCPLPLRQSPGHRLHRLHRRTRCCSSHGTKTGGHVE